MAPQNSGNRKDFPGKERAIPKALFHTVRISAKNPRYARVFAALHEKLAATFAASAVVGFVLGAAWFFGGAQVAASLIQGDVLEEGSPAAIFDVKTQDLISQAEDFLQIRAKEGKLILGGEDASQMSPDELRSAIEAHIAELDAEIQKERVEYALSCKNAAQ